MWILYFKNEKVIGDSWSDAFYKLQLVTATRGIKCNTQ